MAGRLTIYSIYKLGRAGRYYLLQTDQPGYANASQSQQDAAQAIEQASRQRLLTMLQQALPPDERQFCELIGELQELPVGDALFTAFNYTELPIYYLDTRHGYPWLILGEAASGEEFLAEVEATEELLALQPVGSPIRIVVTLVRERA
jgi:hypothetical protein